MSYLPHHVSSECCYDSSFALCLFEDQIKALQLEIRGTRSVLDIAEVRY